MEGSQPPEYAEYGADTSPGPLELAPDGNATAALVLGIIGLLAWCLPIGGLPITIVGVVLGAKSLHGPKHGTARAGLILSIIGLVLTLTNAIIGAYLGATGRLSAPLAPNIQPAF